MKLHGIYILILILLNSNIFSQKKLVDKFDNLADWKIYKSDGVDAQTSYAEGYSGKGIKFSYNFTKGSGYGGIQKVESITLPENFQFIFYIRGESPNNNFEIKFIDKSGENVWWVNNRNFEFPKEWKKITIKKRHISFAWGPTEDKSLKKIDRIEFTIASFSGGKGAIFLDELYFEDLPPVSEYWEEPAFTTTGSISETFNLNKLIDNDTQTKWLSNSSDEENLFIDLKHNREIGGLIIDWDANNYPEIFDVYISQDKNFWEKYYSVSKNRGERSYVRLPGAEARYIQIRMLKSITNQYGINEIKITDPGYSEILNRFFINIAKDYPRGFFPRYFYEEASYWNIVGVNSDVKEALINEDGMVEVDKAEFSIEPMIFYSNKLYTWNDVEKTQSLLNNYIPIPKVSWKIPGLTFNIEAFAYNEPNKSSSLYLIYKFKNDSPDETETKLFLLLRPFQVNPYYQELNLSGGISNIREINISNNTVEIDGNKTIFSNPLFDNSTAVMFEEGNIVSLMNKRNIPDHKSINDQFKLGSVILAFDIKLRPGQEKEIFLEIPFYKTDKNLHNNNPDSESLRKIVQEEWENKLSYIKFRLPESADKIINTYKSYLAYILINRDNYGIQPGSRSYERSWIRDGSLTSSALLKSGIKDEVKEFIKWYSAHQYENGKIPCVVDSRGPDPVPENDSHGEYIYLVKQYFNFTKDTSILKEQNPVILKTVDYINSLISQRSTEHFRNGNDSIRAYYGIMPESISHEGYSAKPMHSYWDNFFTIRGLKDAADIQYILGEKDNFRRISAIRDTFRNNLYNSLKLAIKTRNIDFIPGSVELGDFDATSTTIALYPCNEYPNLPQPYLNNTFEKYFKFFIERRDSKIDWSNYTPYEVRTIGSFIFLDQPDRAHQLIEFFLKDQRPQGWNHWAEVVWNDERKPGFIGDMPHTWVGSDFINAIRAMLVYENDYDSSLVIGAGLYQNWIDAPDGMSVENLPTYFGDLSYSVLKNGNSYKFNIYGSIVLPSGNIRIKNFNSFKLPKQVMLNGKKINNFTNKEIPVNKFPAELIIEY